VRGKQGGRWQLGLAAVPVALLLASCSSGPSKPTAAPPSPPHHRLVSTSSTTTTTTTTTVPTPSAALQAGSPIPIPFTADRVTAAEGPDGAVFAAPQDPTSPSPAVAWVVDGDGPAAVAENVPDGIAALAADSTNFYVATYSNVLAYNRASGNQDGQWTLPPISAANSSDNDLVNMAAAGGAVLVSLTQGNTVSVYRINPSSSAAPQLLVRGLGVAFGPDGSVYYEQDDHHLAVLRPDGSTSVGPELAATPNGLGGGVQYVDAVAGGAVWVSEPAGQGLDAHYTIYDATTLEVVGSYDGSVTSSVEDSEVGPLVLEIAGSTAACPPPSPPAPASCVFRIDQHGAVSDPVSVGAAVNLLGPDPAVIVSDTSSNQFDLVRLS
jgi:hypothetical protein